MIGAVHRRSYRYRQRDGREGLSVQRISEIENGRVPIDPRPRQKRRDSGRTGGVTVEGLLAEVQATAIAVQGADRNTAISRDVVIDLSRRRTSPTGRASPAS